MNKPQVVVELMDINWGNHTFDGCVNQLMFVWANERALPLILLHSLHQAKEAADE